MGGRLVVSSHISSQAQARKLELPESGNPLQAVIGKKPCHLSSGDAPPSRARVWAFSASLKSFPETMFALDESRNVWVVSEEMYCRAREASWAEGLHHQLGSVRGSRAEPHGTFPDSYGAKSILAAHLSHHLCTSYHTRVSNTAPSMSSFYLCVSRAAQPLLGAASLQTEDYTHSFPCGSCLLRSSTETNTICLVSGVCFSSMRDSPDHDDYLCVLAQADGGRALPARKTRFIVQIGSFFLLCFSDSPIRSLGCRAGTKTQGGHRGG